MKQRNIGSTHSVRKIEANTGVYNKNVHQKMKEVKGEQKKQGAYDQKMETF